VKTNDSHAGFGSGRKRVGEPRKRKRQCQHKDYARGRERGCYHCTQWANLLEAKRYADSLPLPKEPPHA